MDASQPEIDIASKKKKRKHKEFNDCNAHQVKKRKLNVNDILSSPSILLSKKRKKKKRKSGILHHVSFNLDKNECKSIHVDELIMPKINKKSKHKKKHKSKRKERDEKQDQDAIEDDWSCEEVTYKKSHHKRDESMAEISQESTITTKKHKKKHKRKRKESDENEIHNILEADESCEQVTHQNTKSIILDQVSFNQVKNECESIDESLAEINQESTRKHKKKHKRKRKESGEIENRDNMLDDESCEEVARSDQDTVVSNSISEHLNNVDTKLSNLAIGSDDSYIGSDSNIQSDCEDILRQWQHSDLTISQQIELLLTTFVPEVTYNFDDVQECCNYEHMLGYADSEVGVMLHQLKSPKASVKLYKEMKAEGFAVSSGKWSKQEIHRLMCNYKAFIQAHKDLIDFEPDMFMYCIHHKCVDSDEIKTVKEFIKTHNFYRKIAIGIDRNLLQVYIKADIMCQLFMNRNKFSHADITRLCQLYEKFGPQWDLIGYKMRRPRKQVFDKWIAHSKSLVKGFWSVEEDKKLIEAVEKVQAETGIQANDSTKKFPWRKVMLLFTGRSKKNMRARWFTQLSVGSVSNNKKMDLALAKTQLYEKLVEVAKCTPGLDIDDVDWDAITSQLGFANRPYTMYLWRFLKSIANFKGGEQLATILDRCQISVLKWKMRSEWCDSN